MEQLVAKYAEKMVSVGLAAPGEPLVAGLDAELVWNRPDPMTGMLEEIFSHLNINSLVFCRPIEPYASMIRYLAHRSDGAIVPRDSETHTFLHDFPVVSACDSTSIAGALMRRKGVILSDGAVVAYGTVSPEQAFVTFSSICFSCFVKFHADLLKAVRTGEPRDDGMGILRASLSRDTAGKGPYPALHQGPFSREEDVHGAIIQVGKRTVERGLVDSFFGNISYLAGDTLYITQTSSSLDELEGCIDPCPLDGSTAAGITASSELIAHLRIVAETENKAILHGHPKFPVILSLDCEERDCKQEGRCHTRCPKARHVEDIPIVPGEIGAGPFGLHKTLPPAIKGNRGVIVFGHGVFTAAPDDFNRAFDHLVAIDDMCRDAYYERVGL